MVKRLLPFLAGLLTPIPAFAFQISDIWYWQVCDYLPCTAYGGGANGLVNYLLLRVVVALEAGFVAVAIITLFLSAANMVIFAEQEDVVKQSRTQFVYAIAASAVVALARWVALAFSPESTGSALVNTGLVNDAVGNVLTYMRLSLTILLVVNIVIQGIRMISSQGEQEQMDKARKRLIGSFIGAAFLLLANRIVVAFNPQLGSSQVLATEFAGIANYLIAFIGFGAVVVIIVAGITLVLSVDESFKDKAKNMVKTAVVALVAVLVAYALMTTFVTYRP